MSVRQGERLGIVGENGSGKSTLLRLLAGAERPDDGEVVVPADAGYLGQTLDLPLGHTVQQAVDAALADVRAMQRRMRELESALTDDRMEEYGDLVTAFETHGGYGADARVDKSLHGLGLTHVGRDRVLSSLSGGEQARLGLACLLAASPETLLLDEPTNHLDESALTWLEERLRDHRGTVAVVSHDRIFLDRVATSILEVEGGTTTRFGGGYSGFLAAKAAARARHEQAHAAWREEVRQVREYAATTAHRVAVGRAMRDNNKMAYDRNAGRVQSSIAGRVRNAQERLRRLEEDPVPEPPQPLRFRGTFGQATTSTEDTFSRTAVTTDSPYGRTAVTTDGTYGRPEKSADGIHGRITALTYSASGRGAASTRGTLAELHDVRVGDRLEVRRLTIAAGERLLVRGANGAGKSTLLRAIAERARGRVGHLPQEVVYDPGLHVLDAYDHGPRHERRSALLATGLFRPETLDLKVGALSVGQQRRLALAGLLAGEHDLLLLDEPTNHLSLALVEELEQALDGYPGALVIVSHDRALRRRFRGAELEISEGRIC
ncbi:ABC-F family ATP-binding cassette domain-containing protein [Nonomuraea sp. LPB2021202275-12-8]|uniref:ABC-F family ATP-binding cassette domain-containing protein n=1 Tax=Nonomuraea sp. LPB2021202275-12-8 TaxID=3120159 RepID=UPI00300CF9EA